MRNLKSREHTALGRVQQELHKSYDVKFRVMTPAVITVATN